MSSPDILSDAPSSCELETSSNRHTLDSSCDHSADSCGIPSDTQSIYFSSPDVSTDVSCLSSVLSDGLSSPKEVLPNSKETCLDTRQGLTSESVSPNSCESDHSVTGSSISGIISDRWMTALTDTLHLPSKRWVIQTLNSNLAICKLSCTSSQALRVLYSVTVMPDYGWILTVYGRQVDPNQCSLLCDVPMQLTSETLQSMLLLLHECNICAGHSDPDFVRMAEARKGKLLSQSGDRIVAYYVVLFQ